MGRSPFAKGASALIALARIRSLSRVRRLLPATSHRARAWIAAIATSLLMPMALVAAAPATPAMASTPAPLVITTSTPLTATAGSAFLAKLDAAGGTKPYTWSLAGGTSLPAGLVLHASTGEISGKPVGPAGTFNFIAEVTDTESPPASATAAESITVTVNPLTVTTTALPAATAGVPYSATLAATGGVAPYSWSIPVGSLPAGLTLHAATGVISGTPKAGGTFTFTAAVTDSEAQAQVTGAPESITVGVAGLVVTTGSTLPTATSGVPYSVKLAAAGGITPYQWSLASGSLPAGLTLKSGGVLSGTTTATGLASFTVRVTDSEAPAVTATENLSLYVVTPMVVPAALPAALVDRPYDTSLQPAGGLGPYSYAITAGSLPPGLTLQPDGEITGQASANGTTSFTVSVTDSENPPATVTQAESITVTGTPVIYVATDGSDTNAGTQTAPLQTIGAALTLAGTLANPVIDVAGGSYNEGQGISLISNLTINGGYSEGAWTQTSQQPTTIIGSPQAALADGTTGVSIDDVTLAPTAPTALGSSVYGLRAVNGSSVALTDVTIDTPNAAQGALGTPGSTPAKAADGQAGSAGSVCPPPAGPVPGGGGTGGGTGASAGGTGGAGGVEIGGNCGAGGTDGSPGAGPNPGSPGGGGSEFNAGAPGGSGGPGADGTAGPTNFFNPGHASATWAGVPGADGLTGGNGSGGGGGGGGGGAGCILLCTNPLGTGGGGGGGGAGGAGGTPGAGGGAGGGAFGIYLWSSSVNLVATTVQVGNGGPGGSGGNGGVGGSGGNGGVGGSGGNGGAGRQGGSGGVGGTGGNGGAGSGGTGGPSIGIFRGSGSTESADNASLITVGAGGTGGLGGTLPAAAPSGGAGLATAIL